MTTFALNGVPRGCGGPPDRSLLEALREDCGITTVKDGCSGQGACGACLVEIDGKAALACRTALSEVQGREVRTLDGFPEAVRRALAAAFVGRGAVQCGFCTPGILTRAAILLAADPAPDRAAIVRALRPHLCRCTGYVKIVEAIEAAAADLRGGLGAARPPATDGRIGQPLERLHGFERALGRTPFVDDLRFDGLLHGALRLSDHPRARVLRIDTRAAAGAPGVVRVLTAVDVPGERSHGLIRRDWPLLVGEGETTRYVGDVLAVVVAATAEQARAAAARITASYEELEPVTDPVAALAAGAPALHAGGNLLQTCVLRRGGSVEEALAASAHRYGAVFRTQRIEHAFLETEAAVALPEGDGVRVYSHGQGIYDDRRQIAAILGIPEPSVRVSLLPSGGAFGGKEDLSVQGHAALCAWLLRRPVKVRLTRSESMRVHPKRHPMTIAMEVGCDRRGLLTAVRARIVGDTGAYASVGAKVLERAAGHAGGAYHVPCVDVEARTVYTNNVPSGAMRGFGVPQVTFALESCLDELCELGGFDRWQFRYDNALVSGSMTATGQVLGGGVGVRAALLAVRDDYLRASAPGLACGLKNTGIGNGVLDEGEAVIEVVSPSQVIVRHGWTEMGQGIDTIAVQALCQETGLDPGVVNVRVRTDDENVGGMTTASRGSAILGNSIIAAAAAFKADLARSSLADLVGRTWRGRWACDWTTAPGAPGPAATHFAYGYAAQLVELAASGEVARVTAAHDVGRVLNPTLFEGQVQGAVVMGLGYALSEDLPMEGGRLRSDRLADCGLYRADRVPEIVVRAVEVADPVGPYGAKGLGEIGLVPTAAAVANALRRREGRRRFDLPLRGGTSWRSP